jgi:hypothetical protein
MKPTPPASVESVEEAPPAAETPKWGPTAPEDVKLMQRLMPDFLTAHRVRAYGWFDSGYTFSTTGPGQLLTQPRENQFGDQYLFNQLAFVLDRPLDPERFSMGFNATFYMGADAALLTPLGGIQPSSPTWGYDFRNLYISMHLPVITEGGLDVRAGRMGTIIGYESALAPYRPFYSNDYQWFYAEDGAWTGVLTNLHVSKRLDVLNGITFGANTFFEMRGSAPCYIGQINYWLQDEKRTLVSAGVYCGPNAIFAAPGLAGTFDTTIEARIQHQWTPRLFQVLQTNMGWDANSTSAARGGAVGTWSWYGIHSIVGYHLLPKLDVNARGEWFRDVGGTRTGFDAHFAETTLGLDFHPVKAISLRPEIRGDFSGVPAFSNGHTSMMTLAFDALAKF